LPGPEERGRCGHEIRREKDHIPGPVEQVVSKCAEELGDYRDFNERNGYLVKGRVQVLQERMVLMNAVMAASMLV
jgi:hypothetical protein